MSKLHPQFGKLLRGTWGRDELPSTISCSTIPFDGLDTRHRFSLDYILSNVQDDERPFLKVSVLGYTFLGLLDSGASRTIVGGPGWDILQRFGFSLIPSSITNCSLADGKGCSVLGTLLLPITVETKTKLIEVLVIPTVSQSIILGIDFWRIMGVVPDFRRGQWPFVAPSLATITADHVQSLSELSSDQQFRLYSLLDEAFLRQPTGLGCTDLVQHEIRTSAEPINQRYYPLSPTLQKQVDIELDDMIKMGVIERSKSPWASPIVLARKKDGTYRFCIDFRKVNEVTEKMRILFLTFLLFLIGLETLAICQAWIFVLLIGKSLLLNLQNLSLLLLFLTVGCFNSRGCLLGCIILRQLFSV